MSNRFHRYGVDCLFARMILVPLVTAGGPQRWCGGGGRGLPKGSGGVDHPNEVQQKRVQTEI